MQKLAKDGSLEANNWNILGKDAPFDSIQIQTGKWLVHALTFIDHADELSHNDDIGIWLDSDDKIESIVNFIGVTAVIAINFPAFADGRGFSLAQQLKEEYSFEGEICALGQFMEEQLFYLKRCGFDSFIVSDDTDADAVGLILQDFTNNYQGSSIEPKPLFRRKS